MSAEADSQALDQRVEQAMRLLTRLVESGKHYPSRGVLLEVAAFRRACARSERARERAPKLRLVR